MKYDFLFNRIDKLIKDDENHSLLSYSSVIEEALKLVLYAKNKDKLIVIKENAYLATKMYEILNPYFESNEVILFLPEESLRAEAIVASYENRAERLYALYRIIKGNFKIIVTSPYGYIRHLPNKELLLSYLLNIKVGDILKRDDLIQYLNRVGYEKASHVSSPLQYAVRGSIVDVYSVNYQKPIRIEFFDDEIDSIRFFDLNSQATIEVINEIEICFAKDVFFDDEEKERLKSECEGISGEVDLDVEYIEKDVYASNQYFYRSFFSNAHLKDYLDDYFLYLSDKDKISEHLHFLGDETVNYIQEMFADKKLPLKYQVYGDFHRLCMHEKMIEAIPFYSPFPLIVEVDLPHMNLVSLINLIKKDEHQYVVVALGGKEYTEVKGILDKNDIKYHEIKDDLKEGINLLNAALLGGFEIKSLALVAYTASELFKNKKRVGRFGQKYEEATVLSSYEELKPGDYVVHDQYGIGQFLKIETREVNGIALDYLKIIYRGNDELLVPLSQFSLVRKYVSKDGVVPKLHKLGTKDWQNTKAKVEASVSDLAKRLVKLYALREEKSGFAFSKDSKMQREFEDEFIYDLTDDQARAIKEVKEDMESKKPMDRLLCGDVGFGKTEVAIRASFKAVVDHKQVAYLCPTTILSLQHYETFKNRFANYPVRIELLNRYITPVKQKEILKDLSEGKIDILIGTHRILSKDIVFNDLGLLIIDEEQRFGVEHKERIKEFKNNIDVLSLSATPIPRTLQMSLVGIRSLSTLDKAPNNRYPVQTYVVYKKMGLIKEVIMRELVRGGQVFYLFNNIEEIYLVARKIEKEIPQARVKVAHGRMSREEMEDVMMEFYDGSIDVLICTTIIETGIDIPNANTIIIDSAQNFGLSQLYQIKGRVGRSDKVAYAYLLIPEKKSLNEKSEKRLEAIKEFTALGSGYKIAMRDLAIRGAGDLLGPKQSGFIDNVGLDLYLMMLHDAIAKEKGEEVKEEKPKTSINIPIASYIPENFSESDYDKLSLYHELDAIDNKEDLLAYYLRVQDEYGKLPKEVKALFDKKRMQIFIELEDVESIKVIGNDFKVTLTKKRSDQIDGMKLFELCNNISRDINIKYTKSKLELTIKNRKDDIQKIIKLVDSLDKVNKQ